MNEHEILSGAASTGVGDERSLQNLVQHLAFPIRKLDLVEQLRARGLDESSAAKIEACDAESFASIGNLLTRIEGAD